MSGKFERFPDTATVVRCPGCDASPILVSWAQDQTYQEIQCESCHLAFPAERTYYDGPQNIDRVEGQRQ